MSGSSVDPSPSPVSSGFPNINVYEKEINLYTENTESKALIVPADVQQIVVTLDPSDEGSGTVYTTTDIYRKVKDGDEDVTWVEWPAGEESQVYQDYCTKVTALKFKQIKAGSVKFTVRMQ